MKEELQSFYLGVDSESRFASFRISDLKLAAATCFAENQMEIGKGTTRDEEIVIAFYNDKLNQRLVYQYMERRQVALFEIALHHKKGLQFRFCHLQP